MTSERSWTTHDALRTTATGNLLAEAERAGVAVFVKESITLGYGDHGERWIAEDTPLEESNTVIVAAAEGERLTNGFTGADRRGVVLRFGLFYGPSARSTDEALRLARFRLSMLPGPAHAYVTSTHVDDVASAVVAALTVPAGVYNVGDDIPLTRRDYVMAFADAFALSPPRLLPAGLLRRLAPQPPPSSPPPSAAATRSSGRRPGGSRPMRMPARDGTTPPNSGPGARRPPDGEGRPGQARPGAAGEPSPQPLSAAAGRWATPAGSPPTPRRPRPPRRTRRRNRSPAGGRMPRSRRRSPACRRPAGPRRSGRSDRAGRPSADRELLGRDPAERHVGGADAVGAQHDLVQHARRRRPRPRSARPPDSGRWPAHRRGARPRRRRCPSRAARSATPSAQPAARSGIDVGGPATSTSSSTQVDITAPDRRPAPRPGPRVRATRTATRPARPVDAGRQRRSLRPVQHGVLPRPQDPHRPAVAVGQTRGPPPAAARPPSPRTPRRSPMPARPDPRPAGTTRRPSPGRRAPPTRSAA